MAGRRQHFPHGRNRPVAKRSRQPLKPSSRNHRQKRPWPPKPGRNSQPGKPQRQPRNKQVLPHRGPVIMHPPMAITRSSRRGSSHTTGPHTPGHPIRNRQAGIAQDGCSISAKRVFRRFFQDHFRDHATMVGQHVRDNVITTEFQTF